MLIVVRWIALTVAAAGVSGAACGDQPVLAPHEFELSAEITSFLDPDGASIAIAVDGRFSGCCWLAGGSCAGQLTELEMQALADALSSADGLDQRGSICDVCDGISYAFSVTVTAGRWAGESNSFKYDDLAADPALDALAAATLAPLLRAAR